MPCRRGITKIVVASCAAALLAACGGDDRVGPSRTDLTPPSVVSTTPAASVTGLPIRTTVDVVFSEPVEAPTSGPAAIVVTAGDRPIRGAVSVDGATLRFTPYAGLELGTAYTVTVAAAVADTAGNAFGQPFSFGFHTHGSAVTGPGVAELRLEVERLADDSMLGRGSGTAAELKAAEYIRSRFAAAGLSAPGSGAFQLFDIPPSAVGGETGVQSRNVLGVIPGSGTLAGEWIVVGAHYDHVGVRSGEIFNGADDNASGTAMVLELARVLAAHVAAGGTADEPRRSILFAGFGAEELGLIGSEFFCANPTTPLQTIAAMVNFDMVGRMYGDSVIVSGDWTSPDWPDLIGGNLPAGTRAVYRPVCLRCTDMDCFRRNLRPAIWFHTGDHADYHTPGDDAYHIDFDGMARIGAVAARTILDLSVRPAGLPFGSTAP